MLPAIRISFTLTLLTICLLLGAEFFGFTPKEQKYAAEYRKQTITFMALQLSIYDPVDDKEKIQRLIRHSAKSNPYILSSGIRLKSGEPVFQSNNHEELWENYNDKSVDSSYILVPIQKKGIEWGRIEFRLAPLNQFTFQPLLHNSIVKTGIFITFIGFFTYLFFIMRILRQLDPSAVVPERVNAAFDAVSEGVIIIDENEYILLSNKAFCQTIGWPSSTLLGKKISELRWKQPAPKKPDYEYPWVQVLKSGESSVGAQWAVETNLGKEIKFAINSSPIKGEDDKAEGVLITLDDITKLEQRNNELKTTVSILKKTQTQVKK